MRKYMVIMLSVLLIAAAAGGCGAESGIHDCLTYQRSAAGAVLSGRLCGVEFGAELTLGEWSGEAGAARDFLLEYTSPESLEGISVRCEGGVYAAECGGVGFPGDEAARLALPALAFCLGGEVVSAGAEKGDGVSLTIIELRAVSAPGFEDANARISVDSVSGAPRGIALSLPDGREIEMDVTEFRSENG